MKSILKILVLGVVPILAATAVVDQGLAADKGSQLIFQSHMDHQNYISVANTINGKAVTVLVQYYNDELERVIWYLRVIPGGGNVLIDPFDHEIPGTAALDEDGMEIAGTGTNVSELFDNMPAMTNDDDGPGINSGRFVIVVTAVGANVGVDVNENGTIADVHGVADDNDPLTTVSVGGYRILPPRAADATASPPVTALPARIQLVTKTVTVNNVGKTIGVLYAAAGLNSVAEVNRAETVNVLFPTRLAAGMHGVDNIDNGGTLTLLGTAGLSLSNKDQIKTDPDGDGIFTDTSEKNVGGLTVNNAVPIAFNHLTGHYTEALSSTAAGGSDQSASWGGTPIIRPAVSNTANGMTSVTRVVGSVDDSTNNETDDVDHMVGDYHALDGMDSRGVYDVFVAGGSTGAGTAADPTLTVAGERGWTDGNMLTVGVAAEAADSNTGRPAVVAVTGSTLADAAGTAAASDGLLAPDAMIPTAHVSIRALRGGRLAEKDAGGGEVENVVTKGPGSNRGLMGGALVLPALHGGGAEANQIMLFLSAADHFGGAGGYKLVKAKTKYTLTVHDGMGNVLANPADDRVFGGAGAPDLMGLGIIVEGISVMTDAGKCGGDMIAGYWTLADLTSNVPTASSGAGKFAGLDAMLDPAKNASPGFIKFMRTGLECVKDFGDGSDIDGDPTPAIDKRTYKGGTLIVEKDSTDRAFVTTGRALLKFITPNSTFAASWSLKSPTSPAN